MRCAWPILGISDRSSHSGLWIRRRRLGVASVEEALLRLRAVLWLVVALRGALHVFSHRSRGGLFVGLESSSAFFNCAHSFFELSPTSVRMRAPGLRVAILLNVFTLRTILMEAVSD